MSTAVAEPKNEPAVEETVPEGVKDVSFDQAAEEAKAKPALPSSDEGKDVIDVLQPKAKVAKWEFGPENLRREYVQRPLSFLGKMQWFALVGDVLDKAISGPDGLSIGSLLQAPGGRTLALDDFREADTFVAAVGKLLKVAPTFLVDSYSIWLGVPDYDKELFAELLALPEEEGGLSDKQGIEIIETFIDQNYEALDRFFRDEISGIQNRLSQRAKEAAELRSSKP